MKNLFVICLLSLCSCSGFSQSDSIKVYNWIDIANANPDTIYGVSLSKMKLGEIPVDLEKFKNLQILDLSKNKISNLPDFIGDFDKLIELNISKNDFEAFPIEICKLTNLTRFIANRNPFDNIPECIGYCTKLEYIDLWETPISSFPESIDNLKALKEIDLRGIKYGPTFQKEFKKKIPWVTFKFDPPCDCME